MTTYEACACVEGFDGEEHSQEEIIAAWQFLIDTGACWSLQGWYGRTAHDLIENGICKPRLKQSAWPASAPTPGYTAPARA